MHFWQLSRNRSAAAESPTAVTNVTSAFSSPAPSTKGRHFIVICCESKAIFLDLVTMRGRDVPKQDLDNKSLLWQVFSIYTLSSVCLYVGNVNDLDALCFYLHSLGMPEHEASCITYRHTMIN